MQWVSKVHSEIIEVFYEPFLSINEGTHIGTNFGLEVFL